MTKTAGKQPTQIGRFKTSISNGNGSIIITLIVAYISTFTFRSLKRNTDGKITRIVFCIEGPEVRALGLI